MELERINYNLFKNIYWQATICQTLYWHQDREKEKETKFFPYRAYILVKKDQLKANKQTKLIFVPKNCYMSRKASLKCNVLSTDFIEIKDQPIYVWMNIQNWSSNCI